LEKWSEVMLNKYFFIISLLSLLILLASCKPDLAEQTEEALQPETALTPTSTLSNLEIQSVSSKNYRPLIMAHYMPWYQTPETSGAWGWHWTMNHFNPNEKDENGRSPIASHYYPLTGPYDSRDADLLEYQVMLMKISGIDGVIVDWYGKENFWDYGRINRSTHKLFDHIQGAGLLFAITYEDQTIKNMIENGHPGVDDAHEHGQEVMLYLQENWFNEVAYLQASGRPVLLTFGNPSYFSSNSDWEKLFSVLDVQPMFINQDDIVGPIAESSYPWPPMHLSGGGEVSLSAVENYLNAFYAKAAGAEYVVASAFPGFHDIYQEAIVGPSYGYIDDHDGETFAFTFQKALEIDPDVIQIVTWNDYGEGTVVEPTLEHGYQYLEMIQKIKIEHIDSSFPYTAEDLTIPIQIFNLRKQHKGDQEINDQLDRAVNAVFAEKIDIALTILAELDTD
jgi:hypothetical protein